MTSSTWWAANSLSQFLWSYLAFLISSTFFATTSSHLLLASANLLDNDDIIAITSTGYFDRKTKTLEDKIKGMKIEVIK